MIVLAGTGSCSTSESIHLSKAAYAAGADAALVVAPYYNRPNQEGLYAHYARIAEATDLPIVLYNVPSRTGCNLEPATVERLSKLGPIVAIKEAGGSLDQVSEIMSRTRLVVLSGDDTLTLPMLALGAQGVISVVGNILPRKVEALLNAFKTGRFEVARQLHLELFPLCKALMSLGPNPVPIKAALALHGLCSGELRLPLTPLDRIGMESLARKLDPFMIEPIRRDVAETWNSEAPVAIGAEIAPCVLEFRPRSA